MPSMSDSRVDQPALLSRRLQSGEQAAEEELARLFSPRIFAVLLARTRDRQASEDLLQDTLLAVLQELRRGSLRDPEKLVPFVHATARNLANNFIRTRNRRPRETEITEDLHGVSPVDLIEIAEREQAVREALELLDSTDRRILTMTLVDDAKPGRIASELGLNSDLVRQRKSRALRRVSDYVREFVTKRKRATTPHQVNPR